MNLPIVSIVMATYNRAHFIVETLQSIENQTYRNWECLIIDDGGTDNTKEEIQSIIDKDSRFIFAKRPDSNRKGLPGCRNYGINIARGEYIVFFDDDDIIHPQLLEISLKYFSKSIEFVHYEKQSFEKKFPENLLNFKSNYSISNLEGSLYGDIVLNNLPLASCTVLWKRAILKKHLFNEKLMYAEEWEYYSRLFIINSLKGIKVNTALYFNRKHALSNTGEFWNNSTIRVESKKKAIVLIAKSLIEYNKLTPKLEKYLMNLVISYRDKKLLNIIFNVFNIAYFKKTGFFFKFKVYPLWKRIIILKKSF